MKPSIETDIFGFSGSPDKINSKAKGNSNERAAAKAMQLWTGYKFVRVPQSGALRWKNSQNVSADLICDELDVIFPFSLETKHLKSISIKRFLSKSSILFTIWEQVIGDAVRSGKLPLALLRANGMPAGEYYLILATGTGGAMMSLQVPILFSGSNDKYSLTGFMFSDVKKHMPYAKFDKAIKKANFTAK